MVLVLSAMPAIVPFVAMACESVCDVVVDVAAALPAISHPLISPFFPPLSFPPFRTIVLPAIFSSLLE